MAPDAKKDLWKCFGWERVKAKILDPFELLKLVLFKVTFESAASIFNQRKLAI